jgi:hypothetical protein
MLETEKPFFEGITYDYGIMVETENELESIHCFILSSETSGSPYCTYK